MCSTRLERKGSEYSFSCVKSAVPSCTTSAHREHDFFTSPTGRSATIADSCDHLRIWPHDQLQGFFDIPPPPMFSSFFGHDAVSFSQRVHEQEFCPSGAFHFYSFAFPSIDHDLQMSINDQRFFLRRCALVRASVEVLNVPGRFGG